MKWLSRSHRINRNRGSNRTRVSWVSPVHSALGLALDWEFLLHSMLLVWTSAFSRRCSHSLLQGLFLFILSSNLPPHIQHDIAPKLLPGEDPKLAWPLGIGWPDILHFWSRETFGETQVIWVSLCSLDILSWSSSILDQEIYFNTDLQQKGAGREGGNGN